MMTVPPSALLVGVKLLITGVGTVKFEALVPVILLTVTEMGPVVAPKGTEVVMLVVVDAVTVLSIPLKSTVFSEGILLKLLPEITTDTPYAPLFGVNPVIEGVPKTVKLELL